MKRRSGSGAQVGGALGILDDRDLDLRADALPLLAVARRVDAGIHANREASATGKALVGAIAAGLSVVLLAGVDERAALLWDDEGAGEGTKDCADLDRMILDLNMSLSI